MAGAGGANEECVPASSDTCEYPESLGGASVPTECGVTPGAWYPLGDSDLTTWPERVVWGSASGGGLRSTLGLVDVPQMAFDPEGRIVVAWRDPYEGADLQFRRWTGSGWDVLAADAPAPGNTRDFEMVLDPEGHPVVVAYGEEMRVLRWDGADWIVLDEWPVADARSAAITLDVDGRPVVVYVTGADDEQPRILVERWNDSGFDTLPGSGTEGSLSDRVHGEKRPAIAVRTDGKIVVAWVEQPPRDQLAEPHAVYVRQFDGVSWEPLGGSANGSGVGPEVVEGGSASPPSLAVSGADEVLVAWDDGVTTFLRVWDGDRWSRAGFEQAEGDTVRIDWPALSVGPQGSVYLSGVQLETFADRALGLWQWDAGQWTALEAPGTASAAAWGEPTRLLSVGDEENLAYAWLDTASSLDDIYLMANTGGEWRELGERTARGDGLDFSRGGLRSVAGALHYQEWGCGIARFDGQAWQDLDFSDWTDPEHCDRARLSESPAGHPVVALWNNDDPIVDDDEVYQQARTLHLLGWTDAGWEELTEPYRTEFNANGDTAVAFDSTGLPVVAWVNYVQENYDVNVVRWDGTDWERESAGGSTSVDGVQLLALPDDRMLLLWGQGTASAVYAGGEWTELPRLDLELEFSNALSPDPLAKLVQDALGTPFVARPTLDGLALFKLVGDAWEPMPADEAQLSTLPERIRLDAYADNEEIYVRRFEDCAWRGLSASDRGGGVSNSSARSEWPSVTEHGGATCVSWTERGEREHTQLIRCHD